MDQPNYPEAAKAAAELEAGLVGDMQPQGISFDAAKAARYAEARSMEAAVKANRYISDFDVRNAAMGHAATFADATIEETVEIAQIIEHYLRFGEHKTAPTATEEETHERLEPIP